MTNTYDISLRVTAPAAYNTARVGASVALAMTEDPGAAHELEVTSISVDKLDDE